jgi:heterodisulfide reductase subunit A
MYGIKNAVMAKELQHDVVEKVNLYYLDLRAFGKGFEEFAHMAKTRFGINFVRGRVGEVCEIAEKNNLLLSVENTELGVLVEEEHEMVVLCPGVGPPKTLKSMGDEFGIQLDDTGFVQVTDPLISPVDTSVPGIFVCGCAESAKDIPDSVASGSAAAMRASIVLSNGGHSE